MIGKLSSEKSNTWTLRIPSHISPRYQTQLDSIAKLFKKLMNSNPEISTTYANLNCEWDFCINLFSSKKIVSAQSLSHVV
jgi:hypothetical protein